MPTLGGAARRRKGHDFERKIANLFRVVYPEAARGIQTRGGSKDAPDVDGTPWYIECKKGKRTNPKAAFEQAVEAIMASGDNRPPLAITKDDGGTALVTMSLGAFIAIMSDLVDAAEYCNYSPLDPPKKEVTE